MMFILLVLLIPYMIPGLWLARGMYAEQVREIRSSPAPKVLKSKIPPKPKRPEITLSEMLHISSGKGCSALRVGVDMACNCKYRDEWVALKNAWLDYKEWTREYGHIDPATYVEKEPTPNMKAIYMAVPFWPLVGMAMYIKGGAKNIPDYREIERYESELNEDLKGLN